MNEKEQTHILAKFIMPIALVILPVLTFFSLYYFYRTHENDVSWIEMLFIPTSVFFIGAGVCCFFITIWWFRHTIKFQHRGK